MLVSWTWLSRYLELKMSPSELADALSLSGLNHEDTFDRNRQTVIDLEVTSNRGDCLGHIGVAREIAVLYDLALRVPDPQPQVRDVPVHSLARLSNDYVEACPQYTARVIRGCQIQPSPAWLADSLRAVGIGPVNNVVDVTNYVMMECGQPLHAFDLSALESSAAEPSAAGGPKTRVPEIRVRRARQGETIEAIDHKIYTLDPSMCVIADAARAVAVAGVMGGAASEVVDSTRDLLIEAAVFTPLTVRQTARTLKLHSPSSFRFERRVDPRGLDWASRRACELITQIAGGDLAEGVLQAGDAAPPRESVPLRLSQIERVLGIRVDRAEVVRILTALGCELETGASEQIAVLPPSWRHDLTREIDMVEEVARIHGYDKIPETSPIAVAPSAKRAFDHAMEKIRSVMTAAGISEAMTPSVVVDSLDSVLSPWTDRAPLETLTPLLRGANRLRRSLLPSLLQSRADNWAAASIEADLYEVAHIYLPGESSQDLPLEQYSVGLVSGQDFFAIKGVVEAVLGRLGVSGRLGVHEHPVQGLGGELSVALQVGDRQIGFLGQVDKELAEKLKLPSRTCVCELSIAMLLDDACLVPQFHRVSPFPAIRRDLNLVVEERVRWADLERSARTAVGAELAGIHYRETYRAVDKDGPDKKRVLLSVDLQRRDATLTGDEADILIQSILDRCRRDQGAALLT